MRLARPCCALAVAVALALAAAPASAHFPQAVDTNVSPGGGTSEVTSSALPPTAKSATITARPSSAGDEETFNSLTKMLSTSKSPKQRLLTCVGIYLTLKQIAEENETFEGADPSLQVLF